MSNTSSNIPSLIEINLEALQDGLELLSLLKDEDYTFTATPAFQSYIGAHFRHVLEHYQCFIKQLSDGIISYDKRVRDQNLELNLSYARTMIQQIHDQLNSDDFAKQIESTTELTVADQPLSRPVATTLERELMFLLAHTVHHYAMIAAMARALGKTPQANFGVAIATQSFNNFEPVDAELTKAS